MPTRLLALLVVVGTLSAVAGLVVLWVFLIPAIRFHKAYRRLLRTDRHSLDLGQDIFARDLRDCIRHRCQACLLYVRFGLLAGEFLIHDRVENDRAKIAAIVVMAKVLDRFRIRRTGGELIELIRHGKARGKMAEALAGLSTIPAASAIEALEAAPPRGLHEYGASLTLALVRWLGSHPDQFTDMQLQAIADMRDLCAERVVVDDYDDYRPTRTHTERYSLDAAHLRELAAHALAARRR